jgi:hypothetical protein
VTYLVELRRHVDPLRKLRPRVGGVEDLESDLSLHNDVLFSLLTASQLVIDIAGELSAREGMAFEDYTTAVRNLSRLEGFSTGLVDELARLPWIPSKGSALIGGDRCRSAQGALRSPNSTYPCPTAFRLDGTSSSYF